MVVLGATDSAYFKMITTDWFEVVNMIEKVMVKIIIHMIVNILIKLLVNMVINIGGRYGGYPDIMEDALYNHPIMMINLLFASFL